MGGREGGAWRQAAGSVEFNVNESIPDLFFNLELEEGRGGEEREEEREKYCMFQFCLKCQVTLVLQSIAGPYIERESGGRGG